MISKKRLLKILGLPNSSRKNLTYSCCIGVYTAFAPFIGCRTLMVCAFTWLFRLNFATTFGVSLLINNPWTMVPVYGAGYFFGEFIFYMVGINSKLWNPAWVEALNTKINAFVAVPGISFWSFVLGGNLLGILIAGMLYPMFKFLIVRSQSVQHEDSRSQ